MSLIDTVSGWADSAGSLSDSVGAWWQTLPGLPGPLMFLQAANAGIDTATSITKDMPLAPAFTRSAAGFISGGSLGEAVRANAPKVASVVSGVGDAVSSVVSAAKDLVTPSVSDASGSSGLPWWVKFTIVGAVLVGTAIVIKSSLSGGESHA
jgi:hypothetical protein